MRDNAPPTLLLFLFWHAAWQGIVHLITFLKAHNFGHKQKQTLEWQF